MPVVRISESQKEAIDSYIEEKYAEAVSYRVAIGDILSKVSDYE